MPTQCYIYHIHAGDGSGIYIGQTTVGGYERPLAHMVGVYRAPNENPRFEAFLKKHSTDELIFDIYYAPDFGVPKEDLDRFIKEWMQDSAVYKTTSKQEEYWEGELYNEAVNNVKIRLNAAEILHTYYFNSVDKSYGTVCALSAGGQQEVLLSREGITLSRDLSPDQISQIISSTGSSRKSLGKIQQIFDEKFSYLAKRYNLYSKCFSVWVRASLTKNTRKTASQSANQIQRILKDFFTEHLQTIIREIQNELEGGHTIDGYRLSLPKGHALTFETDEGKQAVSSASQVIYNYIQYHYKNIEKRMEKEDPILVLQDAFEQAFSHISIQSFIKFNVNTDFQSAAPVSSIGASDETITRNDNEHTITTRLKWKSYFYFMGIADAVKASLKNSFNSADDKEKVRKTISTDDTKYNVLHMQTMLSLIREEYIKAQVTAPFVRNWDKWQEFARGMLTLYTQNRGTILDTQLTMVNEDGTYLGYMDDVINVLDTNEYTLKTVYAYEFSPKTYNYISQNAGRMEIKNLEHY